MDFNAIQALLADFFETDLWNVVQSQPPELEFHFVKATDSDVLGNAVLMRLEAIGRMTGASPCIGSRAGTG